MAQELQEMLQLLERMRDGSEEAAREFLEKYGRHLLTVIRQKLHYSMRSVFDSLDFLQDVWLSFFRGELKQNFSDPVALTNYLTQMAYHKVADEVRKRLIGEKGNFNRESSLEGSARVAAARLEALASPPDVQVAAKEELARLMEGRPEHHIRILQLLSEGHSAAETATQLGLNRKTVDRLIHQIISRAEL
jgi:RNA polymerase sigma factor (sigma-70 family)